MKLLESIRDDVGYLVICEGYPVRNAWIASILNHTIGWIGQIVLSGICGINGHLYVMESEEGDQVEEFACSRCGEEFVARW